jgi:hypothetical protein
MSDSRLRGPTTEQIEAFLASELEFLRAQPGHEPGRPELDNPPRAMRQGQALVLEKWALPVARERDRLASVFRLSDPWSLVETVQRLAEGAEHLLHDHNCDAQGYEGLTFAVRAARDWLGKLTARELPSEATASSLGGTIDELLAASDDWWWPDDGGRGEVTDDADQRLARMNRTLRALDALRKARAGESLHEELRLAARGQRAVQCVQDISDAVDVAALADKDMVEHVLLSHPEDVPSHFRAFAKTVDFVSHLISKYCDDLLGGAFGVSDPKTGEVPPMPAEKTDG